jgi:imidazolonepropionase-like amidohydrolase
MMKSRPIVLTLICVVVVSSLTSAQNSRNSSPGPVLLKAGRLLDVRNGTYLLNQGVLIKDGYIVQVGEYSKLQKRVQTNVTSIDLSQLTLLPGLIER